MPIGFGVPTVRTPLGRRGFGTRNATAGFLPHPVSLSNECQDAFLCLSLFRLRLVLIKGLVFYQQELGLRQKEPTEAVWKRERRRRKRNDKDVVKDLPKSRYGAAVAE
ncbi:Tryptophan--tRNA ligase [Clarias magur]|uniref:Tryptophan--tRNA ligase n=1 Tax=Clarias magur TaxID=1594786 RepID=A0A8J4UUY8_CLAMG|nr:Tryptophan--tRNA ligase [Clarias magur]